MNNFILQSVRVVPYCSESGEVEDENYRSYSVSMLIQIHHLYLFLCFSLLSLMSNVNYPPAHYLFISLPCGSWSAPSCQPSYVKPASVWFTLWCNQWRCAIMLVIQQHRCLLFGDFCITEDRDQDCWHSWSKTISGVCEHVDNILDYWDLPRNHCKADELPCGFCLCWILLLLAVDFVIRTVCGLCYVTRAV